MRAAWYERGGIASEVLTVGEMDAPQPGLGEVPVRVRASGVNPGEVKKRSDWMGFGLGYPRVVPHSDGTHPLHPQSAREHGGVQQGSRNEGVEQTQTRGRRTGDGPAHPRRRRRCLGAYRRIRTMSLIKRWRTHRVIQSYREVHD